MKKYLYLVILAIFMNVSFVYAENYDLSQVFKAKAVTEYTSSAVIGQMDTVTFGSYPQSDESGDVKEPIEWLVLDKQEDKVLLLSKYILDHADYNYKNKDITWEESSIRKWLNRTFYKKAFNSEEQNMILTTNVINNDTINYSLFGEPIVTPGGNNTSDNVFLLSIDEVKKYFYQKDMHTSNRRLATDGTNYAKRPNEKGDRLGDKAFYAWGGSAFWLRSPGMMKYDAAWVNEAGSLEESGTDVSSKIGIFGVRPAIWVSIDKNVNIETQKSQETDKAVELKESSVIKEIKKHNAKKEIDNKEVEKPSIVIKEDVMQTEVKRNNAVNEKDIWMWWYIEGTTMHFSKTEPIGDYAEEDKGIYYKTKFRIVKTGECFDTDGNMIGPTATQRKMIETAEFDNKIDAEYCTGLFNHYENLVEIKNLNFLNTHNVKSMTSMFQHCHSLKSIDLSNIDTSNVTSIGAMFNFCKSLKELDVSKFNTKNVKVMSMLFNLCENLKELDVTNFDTSNATKMMQMFSGCKELTVIDLSNFDTKNVTTMAGMFGGNSKLKTIYVSKKFVTDNVVGIDGDGFEAGGKLFETCPSLVGGNGTKFDKNHIDKDYAQIDSVGKPGYFTLK